MEEEKKMVENKPEENKTEEKAEPVITRSMREEACPTCGATEPSMPAVLPDMSWSIEKLIAATKDKHMLVRSNAIMLLSKRDISESLEALIEALKDEEYLVKSNAMVAIAGYGKQVSDRMIEALEDADKDVRAGAAWVIGELKENRAVAALEKVAKDDYPLARIQAKASLIAMGRGPKKPEAQPPVAQPPEDSPETGDKEAEKSEEKKAE
ncbi:MULTISPECIES: HEAT repeat domain-containing protein [Methanothrix]|jgi:hypothetical protein|uniref:HEAT repeat domain-containing protein n=1 Tax=hydrocarbon metagenome TaxID=938273 RepID=A0A0W8F7U2_9ZZZZ|nr:MULTISPECIES: HEAT repeat domain-containing protein [Methanothrix]OPX83350.1 MAG: HEAT repeat protein [Methanosaeta sp. PtaB.Bin005]HNT46068.1 HEAT repeat domain-containing protein [Methanothrix soehngenii]HNY33175.1 HEAT repeat domain-containing protein [Methanothrix soehngenii]HOE45597.1 HEAT repeat domain-containing protein [Methanothrix soehngenii]HOI19886.1 HEAT repeat domain-containing protein [Methanothrix soehngenii]